MPTYEYECTECGYLFEVFQAITADQVKECPKCNGKVRRLISTGVGLIFKGSGFYVTDYKNNKSNSTKEANVSGNSSGSKVKKDKKFNNSESNTSEKSKESIKNKWKQINLKGRITYYG